MTKHLADLPRRNVVVSVCTPGARRATAIDKLAPTFASAAVVSSVMYPMDVVRALCMSSPGLGIKDAMSGFVKCHGWLGFVKQGMVAEVIGSSMARGVKFWLQPIIKDHLLSLGFTDSCGTSGLSGVIATFPEVWGIAATENIKLTQQLDQRKQFKGAVDVTRHLLRTRGFFGGMFCGYFGLQLRGCIFVGGTFLTIDMCKDSLRSAGVSDSLAVDAGGGFMSGVIGVALNCWADVVRTTIQKKQILASFDPKISRPSVLEPINPVPFFREACDLMSTRGVRGMYAGVVPKMIHLGISNSMLFVLLPRFQSVWFEAQGLS